MSNLIARTIIPVGLLFIQASCLTASHAGEILASEIKYEDKHYRLRLEMKIEAEPEAVYAILTDFNHLKKLNHHIQNSQLLHSDGRQHRVLIEAQGCIWFFCQSLRQVQQVTEHGEGRIQARTVPDQSNLEYGEVMWHIRSDGDFTIIDYRADVVPGFFVPPLIGPYLLKGRLLAEAQQTINEIEQLAQYDDSN